MNRILHLKYTETSIEFSGNKVDVPKLSDVALFCPILRESDYLGRIRQNITLDKMWQIWEINVER